MKMLIWAVCVVGGLWVIVFVLSFILTHTKSFARFLHGKH